MSSSTDAFVEFVKRAGRNHLRLGPDAQFKLDIEQFSQAKQIEILKAQLEISQATYASYYEAGYRRGLEDAAQRSKYAEVKIKANNSEIMQGNGIDIANKIESDRNKMKILQEKKDKVKEMINEEQKQDKGKNKRVWVPVEREDGTFEYVRKA